MTGIPRDGMLEQRRRSREVARIGGDACERMQCSGVVRMRDEELLENARDFVRAPEPLERNNATVQRTLAAGS